MEACLGIVMVLLAAAGDPNAAQTGGSPVPHGAVDKYVPQHFDRAGAYVPPRYEARTAKKKPGGHFYPQPTTRLPANGDAPP